MGIVKGVLRLRICALRDVRKSLVISSGKQEQLEMAW
jgi:hypothetical protein